MGNHGLKISEDGVDVRAAADKELVVTSKYKTFTIALEGTQNVSIASGHYHNQVAIAHGLGYVPAFAVYGKDSGESVFHRVPQTNAAFDINNYFLYAWADSVNIYLEAQFGNGAPSNKTYNFKYYVFNNKIE